MPKALSANVGKNVPNLGKNYLSCFYEIPNRHLSLSDSFLEELLDSISYKKV